MSRVATFAACFIVLAATGGALLLKEPIAEDSGPCLDTTPIAVANYLFAVDLYHEVAKSDGNLVFSPWSVSSALAMLYGGASGETAEQMANVLHFPKDAHETDRLFSSLRQKLKIRQQPGLMEFHNANSLWVQRDFGFHSDFTSRIPRYYGGVVNAVDFAGRPQDAARKINASIARQTRGKISELLSEDDIDDKVRLVLTNAVYMKANWKIPFPKSETAHRPFLCANGQLASVPMMSHSEVTLPYYGCDEFQAIELPYVNPRFVMRLILPNKKNGLKELEPLLVSADVLVSLEQMKEVKLDVQIPRFKIVHRVHLKKELCLLGMPVAFSDQADFSRTGAESPLKLDKVIHQAYVAVDEVGTEAAAATAATGRFLSYTWHPILRADHPFFFMIQDKQTKSVIFMGRIAQLSG